MYKNYCYVVSFLVCCCSVSAHSVQSPTPQHHHVQILEHLVNDCFMGERSEHYSVVVGGESFNLNRLWCEEPWTTKAACIKSAYKYLAQHNELPSHENIKDIFSSCFRFFTEKNQEDALIKDVYNLSCVVLKYVKEGSLHFELAQRATLNAAQLLSQHKTMPSLLDTCTDEIPYWGALCMACLTGITLRRPAIHTVMRWTRVKKDPGFTGDVVFSVVTASLFVACGLYAGYLQARNKMLQYKKDAYENNNTPQPDANTWEIGHTELESFAEEVSDGGKNGISMLDDWE